MEAGNYEEFESAVASITRPAFEGIEEWGKERIAEVGVSVARHFLEDHGYGIAGEVPGDEEGSRIIMARDDAGGVYAVAVAARRLLGYMPEEVEAIDPCPSDAELNRVSELAGDIAVKPMAVVVDYLSDRIALITRLVWPAGE